MGSVRTEEVKLDVAGETMPAFVAIPDGEGPHPAVIVFEEIFGVNAHIRDVAQRIAKEGYVVIAPDYHHRAWPLGTELPYDDEGMKRGMAVIPKLTDKGLNADIAAAMEYLHARNDVAGDRIGAIGFCIGGHVAYYAACTAPIRATASFYGGGIATFGPGGTPPTVTRTKDIKGSIICFFGAQDKMITPENVQTIDKALKEANVKHEIVVYEDTGHAFFCDARGSYNAKDAADAWERVKRFFKQELAG